MKATKRDDLKDIMKKCSCCNRELYASAINSAETRFGVFQNKNQNSWHYQAWCKKCFAEKNRYRLSNESINLGDIKKLMKLKRLEERDLREWTIYKITLDITKFDDRVKNKYKQIANKYYYIGITKQEPEDRWENHLTGFRLERHHNYFFNSLYKNIRNLYSEMSQNEFFEFFRNDIVKFEILYKLDKDYSEREVRVYEAFEVKRLEYNIRLTDKEKFINTLKNKKREKDLCFTSDEMICNIEHSIINTRVKKEIDSNNKN